MPAGAFPGPRAARRPGHGERLASLSTALAVGALLLAGCGPPTPRAATPERPPPSVEPVTPLPAAPPATPAAGTPAVSAPPARLELATTGAVAPVVLAPVAQDGSLAVPDDVSQLGWWVGSAPMGLRTGTTLIAGHVDSAEQGIGVFADLRDLRPGDALTVVDGLGVPYAFAVSAVQEVGKENLPAELFASTHGPRRLALVTCGGPFDDDARRYRDNLIVWADPA